MKVAQLRAILANLSAEDEIDVTVLTSKFYLRTRKE